MKDTSNTSSTPYFEVGAVSKITGLSPNTLRTWERRKFIEACSRSASGRRRYSQEQVEMLALMKKLTGLGDAISSIAELDLTGLRNRLLEYQTNHTEAVSLRKSSSTVLPIGNKAKTWTSILPVQFRIVTEAEKNPDIIVIDLDSSPIECRRRISITSHEYPDTPIALLHDFAPRDLIRQYANEGMSIIRIPCPPELLVHYINAAIAKATHQNAPENSESPSEIPDTPRIFSDKQLATIAASNPNIKCECPHHISALVASLASFENYCRRCENESPEDADVHTYLGTEISKARAIVEGALLYLCEKDNLTIPES